MEYGELFLLQQRAKTRRTVVFADCHCDSTAKMDNLNQIKSKKE